jgi:hypothetical protein
MSLESKIKYAYTWFKIDKNLPDIEFEEIEEKELKLTGNLGWELVQIIELKKFYKYIFKRIRDKDE